MGGPHLGSHHLMKRNNLFNFPRMAGKNGGGSGITLWFIGSEGFIKMAEIWDFLKCKVDT